MSDSDSEDMTVLMERNWHKVCQVLLPDDNLQLFSTEIKVLQIIEKNIYHRKAPALPVTLATVSI